SPPPPLSRYYARAPREFERVVAKALAKNPDARFQTVEEFSAGLEHPENIVPEQAMPGAAASGSVMETGVTQIAPAAAAPTLSTARTVALAPGATAGVATGTARTVPVGQLPSQTAPRISRKFLKVVVAVAAVAAIAVLAVALWPGKKTAIVPASP